MAASIGFDIYARDRASRTFNDVGRSADRTGGKLSKMGRTMRVAGAGIAAGLGVAAVAAYKLGKGAAEDQAAAAKLSVALKNNAKATDAQVAATEDWITAQGKAYGIADDDLRPALGRLVTATHSVRKAQRLTSLAMDVSAGSGKSLEAVTMALMKAQNGQVAGLSRLGINVKDAHGKTVSFTEATKRMSQTFSGQAAKAADTTAGRFARLKLMASEAGESIGYKLLPPATKFAGWMLSTGIPALSRFGDWFNTKVTPSLRQFGAAVQTNVLPALQSFGGWFANKIAPVIADFYQTRLKQLVAGFRSVRSSVQENGPQLRALGQWLKKAAEMAAKVLGPALAFLGGVQVRSMVLQIKSAIRIISVFVSTMQWTVGAARSVGGAIRSMAGAVVNGGQAFARLAAAAVNKIGALVSAVRGIPGRVRGALGSVGSLLFSAGSEIIQGLINGVQSKIGSLTSKLREITSLIPKVKGPLDKDKVLLKPAGVAIMEGLVKGIEKGKKPLEMVLSRVTDLVKRRGDKLKGLLDARNSFASAFGGMTTSIFAGDYGETGPSTLSDVVAQQLGSLSKSWRLKADIAAVTKKGLSGSLIKQFQSQGESGMQVLHLLAQAGTSDIKRINSLNAATSSNLHSAGLTAANSIYGDSIHEARKNAAQAEALAKAIDKQLARGVKKHMEKYEFILRGDTLVAVLKKKKRDQGGKKLGID